MAAKLALGFDPRERLRRLAVVFAVELRLKIVTELYMREMSAKQFQAECGGGALSRVSQNFSRLAETGWLRLVRTAPAGGARRGGKEHYYRATEPAYFDARTWALVPYSLRVASSWNVFKQVTPQLRASLEATNLEWVRDLTCDQWVLDEIGWSRIIEAIDSFFQEIFEEQQDSRLRGQHGSTLRTADIFMVAFESAGTYSTPLGLSLVEHNTEPLTPFVERLAPVFRDDVLLEITQTLNTRDMSPTQFYREAGIGSRSQIWHRFRGLEKHGLAARVREETGGVRRGGTEYFYRATKPGYRDFDPCAGVSASLGKSESWEAFEHLCADAIGSMKAGVFDARTDRYVAWSNVALDERGWERVTSGLDALHALVAAEERDAADRMEKSGGRPVTMTVGLAARESPRGAKAP